MQRSQNISDIVCIHLKSLRKCCYMAIKIQYSYFCLNEQLSASICNVYCWWNAAILFLSLEIQVGYGCEGSGGREGQAGLCLGTLCRAIFSGHLFPSPRMARLGGKRKKNQTSSAIRLRLNDRANLYRQKVKFLSRFSMRQAWRKRANLSPSPRSSALRPHLPPKRAFLHPYPLHSFQAEHCLIILL